MFVNFILKRLAAFKNSKIYLPFPTITKTQYYILIIFVPLSNIICVQCILLVICICKDNLIDIDIEIGFLEIIAVK